MNLIIAGSRDGVTLNDVYNALVKSPWGLDDIDTVISGGARGADKAGETWAYENFKGVIRYPAEWDKHGKSAGYIRNKEMAEVGHALLALWDGKSRGTKHMIDIATKKGLPVYVHLLGDTVEEQ